jgi:hypothetical protein
MAMTSAALFDNMPRVLTNDEINTVLNAVINVINGGIIHSNYLLPSLNTDFIRLAYDEIVVEQDTTVHFIAFRSSFNIYFCKFDNNVYKVITDNNTQEVYDVSRVFPVNL